MPHAPISANPMSMAAGSGTAAITLPEENDWASGVGLDNSTNSRLFPNPVVGNELMLQYPAAADGTVIFRFYDALGRRVRSTSLLASAGLSVLSLQVAGMAPGFYVLQWQDAQGNTGNLRFVRL